MKDHLIFIPTYYNMSLFKEYFFEIISWFKLFFKVILYWWYYLVFASHGKIIFKAMTQLQKKKVFKKEVYWLYTICKKKLHIDRRNKCERQIKKAFKTNHMGLFVWYGVGRDYVNSIWKVPCRKKWKIRKLSYILTTNFCSWDDVI